MIPNEIIEYAIKGLTFEIEVIDNSIRKGQNILKNRNKGIYTDKSSLKDYEIQEVIYKRQTTLKELETKRTDLEWGLVK